MILKLRDWGEGRGGAGFRTSTGLEVMYRAPEQFVDSRLVLRSSIGIAHTNSFINYLLNSRTPQNLEFSSKTEKIIKTSRKSYEKILKKS